METVDTMNVDPNEVFGEGIAWYYVDLVDDVDGLVKREYRLIQLTWKDGIGMIYKITNEQHESAKNNVNNNSSSGKQQLQPSSLQRIHTFQFDTHTKEGWGITFIPHTSEFYVSDGSEYLFVWDATTLQEKRRMPVLLERNNGGKSTGGSSISSVRLKYVNELEFVDFDKECGGVVEWDIHEVYLEECQEGDDTDDKQQQQQQQQACGRKDDNVDACVEYKNTAIKMKGGFTPTMSILANVWYQDVLIRIDPVTAKVVKVYDLSGIYPHEQRRKDGADCLNGIAVTGSKAGEEGLEVWVTGKLWPNMYRIRLID